MNCRIADTTEWTCRIDRILYLSLFVVATERALEHKCTKTESDKNNSEMRANERLKTDDSMKAH